MVKAEVIQGDSAVVMLTDSKGTVRYLNEFGELHRDGDLPALINQDGMFYYKNGLLHRDKGPASITSMTEVYYHYGLRHREGDLPAVTHCLTDKDGNKEIICKEYWLNGKPHRDNGPAILWSSGSYVYMKNGERHNENGPACHYVENGKTIDEYFINGKAMSKTSHNIYMLKNKLFNNNKKPTYTP